MKRHIPYLIFVLIAAFQSAQAAKRSEPTMNANNLRSDCKQFNDNWTTKGSTALSVKVISCSNGFKIIAIRKEGNKYVATESRTFNIAYAGVNEVFADSKNGFYVNFLQATSYANPSIIIYTFTYKNKKWLLEEMSFQASQSCAGEAGVDADYYDINYLTGRVETKSYDGCTHFKRRRLIVRPAFITLEMFNSSDKRLSPFEYN